LDYDCTAGVTTGLLTGRMLLAQLPVKKQRTGGLLAPGADREQSFKRFCKETRFIAN